MLYNQDITKKNENGNTPSLFGENVIEIYTNEVGKSKPVDADSQHYSGLRQQWFSAFESRLRDRYSDVMEGVQIQIIGSVATGLASPDSDIDIIIKSKSSDELLVPRVRNAIYSLLDKMRESGDEIYTVDIQELGKPLMFSAVATFRRQK